MSDPDRLKTIEKTLLDTRRITDAQRDELTSLAQGFLTAGDTRNATAALWMREGKWDDPFTAPIIWTPSGAKTTIAILNLPSDNCTTAQWIDGTVMLIHELHIPITEHYRAAYNRADTADGPLTVSVAWGIQMKDTGKPITDKEAATLVRTTMWCRELALSTAATRGKRHHLETLRGINWRDRPAIAAVLKVFADQFGDYIRCDWLPYAITLTERGVDPDHLAAWLSDMGDTLSHMTDERGDPLHDLWEHLMPTAEEAERDYYLSLESKLERALEKVRAYNLTSTRHVASLPASPSSMGGTSPASPTATQSPSERR